MADLWGVKLKLGRARDHLGAIDDEVTRFAELDPYTAVAEFDDKNLAYFPTPSPGYVVVLRQTKSLDTDLLSLLVGDCVHNLRTALDHLAWQLVLANGGTPDENTSFPIRVPLAMPSGKPWKINVSGGVNAAALSIVKDSQPYRAGNGAPVHPLAIIHDLDRFDKHRTLQPVALSVVLATVALHDSTADARFVQSLGGTFGDGAPIAYFPFAEDQGPMDVSGRFQALVSLNNVPAGIAGEPVTDLLDRLINYVGAKVLDRLGPFVT